MNWVTQQTLQKGRPDDGGRLGRAGVCVHPAPGSSDPRAAPTPALGHVTAPEPTNGGTSPCRFQPKPIS